ncbi:hypothetical protein, conserved [Entamoeba dispar SAW760]|uniref:tRNA(Ile)-lysidine/2-thiocytidine synthase N-terminal domain-containing protein n=1 Tax=Entamoeba dispar (strain ATCC PRA-260 / SAW760) TaxID=370354 RepID=B0EU01_ENTDS|nr:uncharacterized protein EDI_214350 [Entamoeba dispar SAW760]EDR21992.1 hypothetical protein, conserved [Entamoeba dispar SAW760]|eukprot:EDR21992.1 hypothetical protein, conserved [Entamoeba dispar SAW760]
MDKTKQTAKKEEKRLFNKVYSKFWKMNGREKIISPHDRIIIGFSGGKDSFLLVHVLSTLSKNVNFPIDVVAVHVTNPQVGYQLDLEQSKTICESFGVPFISLQSEQMPESDIEDADKSTTFCLNCGKNRRRALLKFAKENGFTSIALGHHMDDVAETLLMNQLFCGCIATIPAQFTTEKYGVKFIRPLIEVPVVLIQEWTKYIELPRLIRCKYEKDSMRGEVRAILEQLKKKHPLIIQSLAQSPNNVKQDYL